MSAPVATKVRESFLRFERLARKLEATAIGPSRSPMHRPKDVQRVPMQTHASKTHVHAGICSSSMRTTSYHMSESHVAIWHRNAH